MNVFVLTGWIPYEGSSVLGVYADRLSAVQAASRHRRQDRDLEHPINFRYYLHERTLGAPAEDNLLEGEEILA